MTNADKFKNIFGLYATELWSMPEKDFLKWLNSEAVNCSEFPNNSDTISRQDAIELVRDVCDAIMSGCDSYYDSETDDEVYKDLLEVDAILKCNKEIRIALRNMPSAQPERTCVNCGRTVNNGGWYADGGTRCPIEEHYALPKDGYCHLWEKRNVTDDDYPERRKGMLRMTIIQKGEPTMLILTLDDAVTVTKQLVADDMDDAEIIRQELEQKCWFPPKSDDAAKHLNDLIFDINPAEICSQIESDNLKQWCEIIQTEMKMAMVQLPCWAERRTDE